MRIAVTDYYSNSSNYYKHPNDNKKTLIGTENREVETKIIDIDVDEVVEKIQKIGGHFVGVEKLTTIKVTDKKGKKFRIRCNGKGEVLAEIKTDKSVEDGVKSATEKVVGEFSSLDEAKKFYTEQGCTLSEENTKLRATFNLEVVKDGDIEVVKFDIDQYIDLGGINIPAFLEIEAKDKDTVLKYVRLLGFNVSKILPWGVKEIKDYYKDKYELILKNNSNFRNFLTYVSVFLEELEKYNQFLYYAFLVYLAKMNNSTKK